MTWVRLDDGFYRHPKARAVGKDGRALFLAACCWSAANLTDGAIPATALSMILSDAEVPPRTVDRLVAEGLWETNGHGWVIHDFLAYNRSRARTETDREAARERQARARSKYEESR